MIEKCVISNAKLKCVQSLSVQSIFLSNISLSLNEKTLMAVVNRNEIS